jgi:hypothetical protein
MYLELLSSADVQMAIAQHGNKLQEVDLFNLIEIRQQFNMKLTKKLGNELMLTDATGAKNNRIL